MIWIYAQDLQRSIKKISIQFPIEILILFDRKHKFIFPNPLTTLEHLAMKAHRKVHKCVE